MAGAATFKTRSSWFSRTRAPASRHTRAAITSAGVPLARSTPALLQADRCSPNGSSTAPHRQWRSVSGNGRRNRTRSRATNCSGVNCVSYEEGSAVKWREARGPH